MKRLALVALLAALPLAFGACSDSSAPVGRPGTLTVQSYVDRDASGSLTPADSALAGMSLTITASNGSTTRTVTTNSAGVATVENLPPDSYRVTVASGAPSDAVLVTNPAPSAVIVFQGRPTSVDFRYSFLPATVSGRFFRDDNASGAFEAGSDTPGAGLFVILRRDSVDAGGQPVAGGIIDSVRTGSDGTFLFPRLAPGAYFVDFPSTTTITPVEARRRIVVGSGGAAELGAVRFTGAAITSVRVARAATLGRTVAIEGTVTVGSGLFADLAGTAGSSLIFVQDSSGGIGAVRVPAGTTLAIGQLVRVVGATGRVAGELVIGADAAPTVTVLTGTAVTAPALLTGATVNTLADEGSLVKVTGVTVRVAPPAGTTDTFTVKTVDATGDTVRVFVDGAATGLTRADFTLGKRSDVSGILTTRDGQPTVRVRMPDDFAVVITPIAEARALANGSFVTVAGKITARPGSFTSGTGGANSEVWIQDATGGIALFSLRTADSTVYQFGDSVQVSGTISRFSGQVQVGGALTVRRIGAGTPVTPRVQTGAQVAARTNEGELVVLRGFVVTVVQTASSTGAPTSFNVTGTAPDGTVITVRVTGPTTAQQNTGLTRANFTVGTSYDITGILTQFNGTAQIKPRMRSDVTP